MAKFSKICVFIILVVLIDALVAHPADSGEDEKRSKSSKSSNSKKKTISIGGFYPQSPSITSWWLYSQTFPFIIEAAFNEINSNPNILPDYELELVSHDTKGEGGLALFELFQLLQDKDKYPVVMGPGRSAVALAVAQVMPHLNTAQVVFSTRTSSFVNRDVYPNSFVANFPNSAFNPVKIAMMNHYGYTRASTVALDDNIYYSETADLHNELRDAGLGLVSGTVMYMRDVDQTQSAANVITLLKQRNPEVVFVTMTVLALATFLCEAKKQDLMSQAVIVASGPGLPDDWQVNYGGHTDCTEQELREASHGIYGVDHFYLREDGDPSVSGKTAADFTSWLQALPLPSGALVPRLSPFAYDAAYAVALALDDADNAGVKLNKFDYDRADIGGAIVNHLQNINFEGVTGPVSFKTDGTRNGCTYLFQVDGYSNNRNRLGVYRSATNNMNWI